jgi:hypothetical protein
MSSDRVWVYEAPEPTAGRRRRFRALHELHLSRPARQALRSNAPRKLGVRRRLSAGALRTSIKLDRLPRRRSACRPLVRILSRVHY